MATEPTAYNQVQLSDAERIALLKRLLDKLGEVASSDARARMRCAGVYCILRA
jgi:hypothetical protein